MPQRSANTTRIEQRASSERSAIRGTLRRGTTYLWGIFGAGYLWPILKTLGRKNWGTWGVNSWTLDLYVFRNKLDHLIYQDKMFFNWRCFSNVWVFLWKRIHILICTVSRQCRLPVRCRNRLRCPKKTRQVARTWPGTKGLRFTNATVSPDSEA